MNALTGVSTLRERLQNLLTKSGVRESPHEVAIESVLEAAGVKVEWEGKYWSKELGEACVFPCLRGEGFIIRIPRNTDDLKHPYKRFVLGHEVGHTLFFGKKYSGFGALRDIWMPKEIEEEICDEISDMILIPYLPIFANDKKMDSIYTIARMYNVPVERAFRRWLSVASYGDQRMSPYFLTFEEKIDTVDIPF